jgi:sterol 3beta-glucosyltransferase
MFGLFAYPFLGMYKSISTSLLSPTERRIVLARQVYGSYMARQREYGRQEMGEGWDDGTSLVLEEFERRKANGGYKLKAECQDKGGRSDC